MFLMLICTGNIYTLHFFVFSKAVLECFCLCNENQHFCEILLLKISHFAKLYFNGYT